MSLHSSSLHQFNKQEIVNCQSLLIEWYSKNKRDLPWRQNTSSSSATTTTAADFAYRVLVAEIMCQQTRIATVIEYFNRWMLKWPTVAALASADLQTVHEMWSGLGYYRRAQNLHKAAQEIVSRFNGAVPSTVAELLSLPGIGPYTAGAIASTAFGVSTPLVDGNVTRVVSRLRAIAATPKDSSKLIWKLCGDLVPIDRPSCFNQGLMELGATICTAKSPKCNQCPLNEICLAYQRNTNPTTFKNTLAATLVASSSNCSNCADVEDSPLNDNMSNDVTQFPMKALKTKQRLSTVAVCVLELRVDNAKSPGKIVLIQRPSTGLLANLFEVPQVILSETEPQKSVKRPRKKKNDNDDDDNDDDNDNEDNNDDDETDQASTTKKSKTQNGATKKRTVTSKSTSSQSTSQSTSSTLSTSTLIDRQNAIDFYIKQTLALDLHSNSDDVSIVSRKEYNSILHQFTHIRQTLMIEHLVVVVSPKIEQHVIRNIVCLFENQCNACSWHCLRLLTIHRQQHRQQQHRRGK